MKQIGLFIFSIFFVLSSGCSSRMVDLNAANWKRPYFESTQMKARLLYFIPGKLKYPLDLVVDESRSDVAFTRGKILEGNKEVEGKDWQDLYTGFVSRDFAKREPKLFEQIKLAPQGVTLLWEIEDPKTLSYLRCILATVQSVLDSGGMAVYDMTGYRWYTAAEWKVKIFDIDKPVIKDQILLLADENESDANYLRVRTQGMQKFARPDIVVKNVLKSEIDSVEHFLFSVAETEMKGKVIKDRSTLNLADYNKKLIVKLVDGREDEIFNNYYIEASLR